MPVWAQIVFALLGAFGAGGFALEVFRRHNAKKDKQDEGQATVVVKTIDDGAQQREKLWAEVESLRRRIDEAEENVKRMSRATMRLWQSYVDFTSAYKVLRVAYDALAQKLSDLGHEPPVEPGEPPPTLTVEEVFGRDG